MAQVVAETKRRTRERTKTAESGPLSADELQKMDAYWRASNYLSVGQIYLLDNPLLKEPLKREHIKPRLLGHWGTSPGLNMPCHSLIRCRFLRSLCLEQEIKQFAVAIPIEGDVHWDHLHTCWYAVGIGSEHHLECLA